MTWRSIRSRFLNLLPSHRVRPFRSWDLILRSTNLRVTSSKVALLASAYGLAPSSAAHRTLLLANRLAIGASGGSGRCDLARLAARPVELPARQHGPDDPRHLGGVGYRHDLERAFRQQAAQPWVGGAAPQFLAQMRAGADDEQRAQGAVALLGDAAGALLAAGAALARRHVWTAPSRQGLSWRLGKRVGSGHVSGLLARCIDRWP